MPQPVVLDSRGKGAGVVTGVGTVVAVGMVAVAVVDVTVVAREGGTVVIDVVEVTDVVDVKVNVVVIVNGFEVVTIVEVDKVEVETAGLTLVSMSWDGVVVLSVIDVVELKEDVDVVPGVGVTITDMDSFIGNKYLSISLITGYTVTQIPRKKSQSWLAMDGWQQGGT